LASQILQINKGSAADRARLIKDDQIVALDGEAVHTVSQFQNAVRARPAGTEIRLRIQRGTETLEIKATLTQPPKEDAG
jgi:putative serine protease PepD